MHTSSPNVTSSRLHRRGHPHNCTCVTLCFVYIIPPCLSSLSLSPFLSLCRSSLSAARENIPCLAPVALPRHTSVTCGMSRRKGVRRGGRGGGGGGGGEGGTEGWFKRVNTSQLRSRRTLLGHWSDRDALHPFPPFSSPLPPFASSPYLPPALVLPVPFL